MKNKPAVLDLFSGIGGFSLGFEKAGFKTSAFCEIDEYCQKVLKQHWPDVPIYNDVSAIQGDEIEDDLGCKIDVITGGFPCQDLSSAGKQKGINEGSRSGLWWQMRRIISEIRPRFAVMENVPNFLSGGRGAWFGDFLGSLAEIGYNAEWCCVSAADVGKPHIRDRIWIIAYPDGGRPHECLEKINVPTNNYKKKNHRSGNDPLREYLDSIEYSIELLPKHLRVDDGLPVELDEIKARVKACGNSIVPEIAYLIAEQIIKLMR